MTQIHASGGSAGVGSGVTSKVAAFVDEFEVSTVPDALLDDSKWLLAEAFSLATSARSAELQIKFLELIKTMNSPEQATVLSTNERIGSCYAAMANGIGMQIALSERQEESVLLRFASAIVPAAYAMAETQDASMDDLIGGFILGLEVAVRLDDALGATHRARGWNTTGTVGHVAAAIAAAKVARMSPDRIVDAVGFAATGSAGLRGSHDLATDAVVTGKAAWDGLESVLLAQSGLTGPPTPLEGRRGLFVVEGADPDPERHFDDIGETWRMHEVARNVRHDAAGESHEGDWKRAAISSRIDGGEVAEVWRGERQP